MVKNMTKMPVRRQRIPNAKKNVRGFDSPDLSFLYVRAEIRSTRFQIRSVVFSPGLTT